MSEPYVLDLNSGKYFFASGNTGVISDARGVRLFKANDIVPVSGEVKYFVTEKAWPPKKGYPKDPKKYADKEEDMFPVDKEHIHGALSLFHTHKFPSAEVKRRTARRILQAAKEEGIDVSKDSQVARAARGE